MISQRIARWPFCLIAASAIVAAVISAVSATLDRFGFFTTTIGGQMVKIYFDDLEYTAGGSGHGTRRCSVQE